MAAESLTAKVRRTPIPVNKLAQMVTSRGLHYQEPDFKSCVISDSLLPTRPYPKHSDPKDDFTGLIFGRFTVIGMKPDGPSWVVRCTCGRYTYRKSRVIRSVLRGEVENPSLMCTRCDRLEKVKAGCADTGMDRQSLHHAALPMYLAIRDILSSGLTDATRKNAAEAIALAEHLPELSD